MRPETAAPRRHGEYRSLDERDLALEARYVFDREGFPSTLAYVSVNAEVLTEQFFEWRRRQPFSEPLQASLESFERSRFGGRLYPAAHGVLWFAIRSKLLPEDGGRVMRRRAASPPVIPNAHNRALLAAQHAMPAVEMSEGEYERRQAELLEQRSRIVGEEG
jgi:hypothetical protein